MKFKVRLPVPFVLLSILSSCCPFVKEESLGNNFYLSEYDNVDRRIFYSKESCSGAGVEIVPMTVLEYSFDSEWIIAKSGSKRTNSNIQYWIIKNNHTAEPTVEDIKSNIFGPLDMETFSRELANKEVHLSLKRID
jgi:hypothetical protein